MSELSDRQMKHHLNSLEAKYLTFLESAQRLHFESLAIDSGGRTRFGWTHRGVGDECFRSETRNRENVGVMLSVEVQY